MTIRCASASTPVPAATGDGDRRGRVAAGEDERTRPRRRPASRAGPAPSSTGGPVRLTRWAGARSSRAVTGPWWPVPGNCFRAVAHVVRDDGCHRARLCDDRCQRAGHRTRGMRHGSGDRFLPRRVLHERPGGRGQPHGLRGGHPRIPRAPAQRRQRPVDRPPGVPVHRAAAGGPVVRGGARWLQAYQAGAACPVVLAATNDGRWASSRSRCCAITPWTSRPTPAPSPDRRPPVGPDGQRGTVSSWSIGRTP